MNTQNLKEVFENRIFRIPDYQRGYAWGLRQLNDLWDDITDIRTDEYNGGFAKHYTGTIFIEQIPNNQVPTNEQWLKGVKFYNIVDGQQRLTTLVILLFVLTSQSDQEYCEETMEEIRKTFIARTNSTGNSKIYKFAYQGVQNDFLLNCIFEDTNVIQRTNEHTAYTQNLIQAKKFFKDKIAKLSSKDAREEIYTKLITALQFDIRDITNDLDVQAVFETMNNRGKPLTVLEKLKNRLIFLNEKLDRPIEDRIFLRKKINDVWGKIYLQLAKNPSKVLSEDDFLSAHLSLYRSPGKANIFTDEKAEVKLFEMFRNRAELFDKGEDASEGKEPAVSYEKIDAYVSSLSDFVPLWYQVNNPSNKMVIKTQLLNGGKEYKIYLCALLKTAGNIESVENILTEIEKIMFRDRIFAELMDERTLVTRGRAIFQGNNTLANELAELQKRQKDNPIVPDSIANGFSGLFNYVYGNKGFHRWGTLKYVLFEYENSLMNEYKETSERVTYDDYEATTIEHIIPQTYQTYWTETVNEVKNRFEDQDKDKAIKVLINTLGNLTILRNGKNSELGNKPWLPQGNIEGKKERYSTGSYNEIEISKYKVWDINGIETRGKKIMNFIAMKLGLNDFTEKQMKTLLFYSEDFYNTAFGIKKEE